MKQHNLRYTKIISALVLSFCLGRIDAQEKNEIDKLNQTDFSKPIPGIDYSAGAVILYDIGTVTFESNDKAGLFYRFKRHIRIKVNDPNGFDADAIEINLFSNGVDSDSLTNLKIGIADLGQETIPVKSLLPGNLIEERINYNKTVKKVILPDIKPGSIIDCEYTIESGNYLRLPDWFFQHMKYPCLYSKFEIAVPALLHFFCLRMDEGKAKHTSKVSREKFYSRGKLTPNNFIGSGGMKPFIENSAIINVNSWEMKDIPAALTGAFLYQPKKYLSRLEFFLSDVQTKGEKDIMPNWKDMSIQLSEDVRFARTLGTTYTENLINTVNKICGAENNPVTVGHLIYDYIHNNFSSISDDYIFLNKDLYEINKNKKGTTEEVNLLLIAMLKLKKIQADPVIVSTRDFNSCSVEYPFLNRMNYVICRAKINNEFVFLDASNPYILYGQLPLECYNGYARVINSAGGEFVNLKADSLVEHRAVTVIITNDNEKLLKGTCQSRFGNFESAELRRSFSKNINDSGFIEKKLLTQKNITISHQTVNFNDSTASNQEIAFDFEMPIDSVAGVIHFNPALFSQKVNNVPVDTSRKLPVEIPYPIDEVYVLNMEIPKGYEVAELPKQTKVKFNETDGSFDYLISSSSDKINLICRTRINKIFYEADEYQPLHDFYSYIRKKMNEQIVLRKRNK